MNVSRLEAQLANLRHFVEHGLAEHPSAGRGLTEVEVEQFNVQIAQAKRLSDKLEKRIAKMKENP